MLTAEQARAALDYDPETGDFRWRQRANRSKGWNARWAGKLAGSIDQYGYRIFNFDNHPVTASRLAWAIMTGGWPELQVDHRNRVRSDNRWDNLRLATRSQNLGNQGRRPNNTSGYTGVSWHRRLRKWVATICVDGSIEYLGGHATPEAAHAVYLEAAKRLRGEFARGE